MLSSNNSQNEYKYHAMFVLQRTGQTGFLATRKRRIGLKLRKKIVDNFKNYFSNDEESEWVANIDPSLLDKSNEEKQLDDK